MRIVDADDAETTTTTTTTMARRELNRIILLYTIYALYYFLSLRLLYIYIQSHSLPLKL